MLFMVQLCSFPLFVLFYLFARQRKKGREMEREGEKEKDLPLVKFPNAHNS